MSIAINTSPANAIADLSDLVREIRDEMDDDGFDMARILRAITRAEAHFNRQLRLPRMEKSAILTTSNDGAELPLDYLAVLHVGCANTPDHLLLSTTPGNLARRDGLPMGAYAIEGRRIVVAASCPQYLRITYHARIPALTQDNPANWLLDHHADLYLHQVLAILFAKIGDTERASHNQAVADQVMVDVQRVGRRARFGAGPLIPAGMQQVRGVRT